MSWRRLSGSLLAIVVGTLVCLALGWGIKRVPMPGDLTAVVTWPKEEWGFDPGVFDEIRPGCWQVDERVKDMNAGGILGSICFPTFPGFAGRLFVTDQPGILWAVDLASGETTSLAIE